LGGKKKRLEGAMVGVVLVTHPNLGNYLIRTAEAISGKIPDVVTVSIDTQQEVDELRRNISTAIKSVDGGEGVLILTDMFGGTPANMSLAFLSNGQVEVLTGLNLPMLIKISSCRGVRNLKELAKIVKESGQRNIILASEILQKKA
jgi:PTS system mannose-specific IIA component